MCEEYCNSPYVDACEIKHFANWHPDKFGFLGKIPRNSRHL